MHITDCKVCSDPHWVIINHSCIVAKVFPSLILLWFKDSEYYHRIVKFHLLYDIIRLSKEGYLK